MKLFLVTCQIFVLLLAAIATTNPYYQIRTWQEHSSLAQGTVSAILQTSNGYIWLGTPTGLIRFDGISTTSFNRQNIQELNNDQISALYQDNNDVLWIGTEDDGLVTMKDNRWEKIGPSNGLSDLHIRCITADWYGQLWVGTDYGLNCINNDTIRVLTTEDGLYDNIITALTVDIQGDLLIGSFRSGLIRYSDGVVQVYSYSDGLTNLSVTALLTDNNGRIWIGTMDGLFYLDLNEPRIFKIPGTTGIPVTGLLQDSRWKIWYSSIIKGIVQLDGQAEIIIDLPDNFVHCLLEDNSGTIWAGTDAAGLVQVKESYISNITRDQGLPDNVITTLYPDKKNIIWAGTRNHGLCKIEDNQVVQILNRDTGLFSNRITALHRDHLDNLWIGSSDSGLFLLSNSGLIRSALKVNHITTIFQEDESSIWIGTMEGIYLYQADSLSGPFISDRHVTAIIHDHHKHLLAATDSGIFTYSDNAFIPLPRSLFYDILSLYADSNGMLLASTNGSGIIILHNEKEYTLNISNGLPDNYILSIIRDTQENFWCSSYKGVFVIRKNDLERFLTNESDYIIPHWFDDSDGMSGSQCQHTKAFFMNGKYHVATNSGVAIIETDVLDRDTSPPMIQISDIRTEYGIENLSGSVLELPAGCELLQIELNAFDYRAPDKLHFRYRLQEFDTTFIYSQPGQNPQIMYRNLPPGEYHFTAQAAGYSQQWSQPAAELSFIIPPPFYAGRLFLTGIILLLTTSVLIIILHGNYRKRRKIRNKYKTVTMDPERTEKAVRQITELMEEKKLYLNPDLTLKDLASELHIHYNHLSRILNEHFKLSYNDFINEFRIRDAMQILSDPTQKHQTILQIMYQTGFYSKSVFNTAFKKYTGKTPSEYRREK